MPRLPGVGEAPRLLAWSSLGISSRRVTDIRSVCEANDTDIASPVVAGCAPTALRCGNAGVAAVSTLAGCTHAPGTRPVLKPAKDSSETPPEGTITAVASPIAKAPGGSALQRAAMPLELAELVRLQVLRAVAPAAAKSAKLAGHSRASDAEPHASRIPEAKLEGTSSPGASTTRSGPITSPLMLERVGLSAPPASPLPPRLLALREFGDWNSWLSNSCGGCGSGTTAAYAIADAPTAGDSSDSIGVAHLLSPSWSPAPLPTRPGVAACMRSAKLLVPICWGPRREGEGDGDSDRPPAVDCERSERALGGLLPSRLLQELLRGSG